MREFFADPVLVGLLVLAVGCGFMALRPRRRTDMLLLILLVGLFALPRAGLVVERIHLPLPVAHVLCGALILEWLLFRRGSAADSFHLSRFFLIYAAVAGLGLVIGLSAGGGPMMAFLELCFYLFSMGLFFYARDTFSQRRHFYTFARWVLILSVCVSGYGIAQRYLGSRTLIGHLTYNTGGSTISRQYVEVDDPAQRRVLGSYGDPNVLAGQLLVFGGIGLALLIGKGVPFPTRLFCVLVVGLNGACLLFTRSRAGLIGGALIVWILFCWRSRWALLGIPVLMIAGYMILPGLLAGYLQAQYHGLVTGEEVRLLFPSMAWQLLQIVPLGSGLGRTVVLHLEGLSWNFEVLPTGGAWAGLNSFWLNLMCRLGVPGVLAFLLILAVLFRTIWRQSRRIEDGYVRAVLIGILAGFVGQCVIWLVNNTFMLPGGGLNFWFTMGMAVAGCRAFGPPPQPYLPAAFSAESFWLPGREAAPAR